MEILIALGVAIAPGIVIALFIYLRDKYDREPLGLLLVTFFLGCLSVVPALISEVWIWSMPLMARSPFIRAYVGTAFVEEFWKLFFILILPYHRKSFNEPFDGIVYSMMVSMGFATVENIMYTVQHGLGIAVLRFFTAVPAHATFAVVMGYFLGESKFTKSSRFFFILLALFFATVLHGTYDYCLFKESIPALALGAFVSLIIGIILSFRAIRIHRRKSRLAAQQQNTHDKGHKPVS